MLKGYKRVCGGKKTAGIVKILIASKDAIASVTADTTDTEAIKAITLSGGATFVKYEFVEDEAEFQENYKAENGILSVEQKLVFKLPGMDPASRTAVEQIAAASSCGIVAVVSRKAGAQVVGWDFDMQGERPLRLNATTGSSGKKLTDASGEEITLSRETTIKAPYYLGDVGALSGDPAPAE